MTSVEQLLDEIKQGSFLSIARALTIVENELTWSDEILRSLGPLNSVEVIGITGPPGAGKSTLVSAIISRLLLEDKKIAVLAVDPTSPFNLGSLLGDRVRMSSHFNHPNVFIRSVATRGSLGGLSTKIIEMSDVLRASIFDYIIVETVGVGQSEIEIAGLADKTIVLLVPESGDEIQHLKSGLMEIADAFVVNKSDREGADGFANSLIKILHGRTEVVPVFKTVAHQGIGIERVIDWITNETTTNKRKLDLYAEKAFKLIQQIRVKDISKKDLLKHLEQHQTNPEFNLYAFVQDYLVSKQKM
ncbi:MAG: methylmalonyl Co-A mutase-associated GTPase MeaB [Arcicella sp.]|nr:methylmalonyl Co-A mutase-associated GTPase MeaB [Arcicella sp.]